MRKPAVSTLLLVMTFTPAFSAMLGTKELLEYWSAGRDALRSAEFPQAESAFKRAVAEAEAEGRQDTLAANLANLANVYQAQARYAEAEPLYRRALAISERVSGPGHILTASILNHLGRLQK